MSYQVAEEMIAKGKVMLNETFVGKTINDFDISKIGNTYYRYSMFTGYKAWVNKVHARVAGDLKAHVFSALIDSIGEAYRRAQENQVIEQTTQVAEVVVDELAVLKAALVAMEAQRDEAVQVANAAINAYGTLAASVRVQANCGVITKTYNEVVSKVGF